MLALRVDRLDPSATPTELGSSLGLPASPVSVLAGIAEGPRLPIGNRSSRCREPRVWA